MSDSAEVAVTTSTRSYAGATPWDGLGLTREARAARASCQVVRQRAARAVERARQVTRPRLEHPLRHRVEELESELAGLQTAMRTRATIEQAKGMIMLRDCCDADAAFQTLVRASQHSHRKLHDVARVLVEHATTRGGRAEPMTGASAGHRPALGRPIHSAGVVSGP